MAADRLHRALTATDCTSRTVEKSADEGSRFSALGVLLHASEVESYGRLVTKHPTIMPRRNHEGVSGAEVQLCAVIHHDDFLLGFTGPRQEAEEIKARLREFLQHELRLELSGAKTLVTHGRTSAARFLGYEVTVLHDDRRHTHTRQVRRAINGKIGLRVPRDVVRSKCGAFMRNGKPIHRPERLNDSEFSIVAGYAVEYRGVVEYYRLAFNLREFHVLRRVMERSLAKTLAAKLRISVRKVYRRFGVLIQTDRGPRRVIRVVVEHEGRKPLLAQWGAVPLTRRMDATLNDRPPHVWSHRSELLERLLADACELCGSQEQVQVHHVRRLADLRRKGRGKQPQWVQTMAARRRKTLVVCQSCHHGIHSGARRATARPPVDDACG